MTTPASLFDRLGRLPPHHLGLVYSAAACVGSAFKLLGETHHAPGLIDLGDILIGVAGLVLYIVVTWYRQDDALAAGVLLALTLSIGTLAAMAVVGMIVYRSLTAGIAVVSLSPFVLLFWCLLLVPLFTAVVWIARVISAAVDSATGASRRDK